MCRQEALSAWIAELESAFAHLSRPQVKVLAQYSLGMVLAGRCGLCSVSLVLSQWMGQKFNSVRERLRDWYCGASDKSGRKRRELDVASCFAPLLAWVLRDWKSPDLAIALDATTLGQRFVVLAISVMYRACAIPVAWVVLPATAKGAWKPHWLELLRGFKQVVPPHLRVIVLADRGLYAKWLFHAIVELGWHPFLRINKTNADFKPQGTDAYVPVASLLPHVGSDYCASGVMFRSSRTRVPNCTLTARWTQGHEEGWFVLTDLPPQQADCAWYGLRGWIERGFKHAKSGGWDWQDTRMDDPQRASRQWLAMAVATVLVLRQGAALELGDSHDTDVPVQSQATSQPSSKAGSGVDRPASPSKPRRRRFLSIFRAGLLIMQSTLLATLNLPPPTFSPEPWPTSNPTSQPP